MTETPDTEKLIRYLDGELDEAEAAATEAQIGRDREFARLAGELQQSTMLLHAAFEQAVRAPLPAKLRGVVDAGLAPRMKAPRRRMFRRSGGLGWGAAAAASVCGTAGRRARWLHRRDRRQRGAGRRPDRVVEP